MTDVTDNLLESPTGNIQFLAIKNMVKNKQQDTEASVYTIRLEFDGSTKEGKEFKSAIEKINNRIVSTQHASKPGNYTVKASTSFYPKVVDSEGNLVSQEDAPVFYAGSTGTATMIVKPYTGNKLGGAINLVGIAIHTLELAEKPEDSSSGGTNDIVNRLRSTLNK